MHEAPMAAIQSAFIQFLCALPFPKKAINTNVLTNVKLKASIPDLRISLQNVADCRFSVIAAGLGETAFSQSLKSLYRKLRRAVEVNPSVLLVIVAVIDETHRYHTPCAGSPAWKTLLCEPTMRSQEVFLAGAGTEPPALNRPVVIEGHMWCSVKMVRFKAWVRLGDVQVDDYAIDIDTDDPNKVAEGVRFHFLLESKLYLIDL